MKQPLLNITKPQPPLVVEKLYPNVIWRLPQPEKTVFLTFDDGPVPIYTNRVLQILHSYNIPATFFCVGENIDTYPDIYQKIVQQNHQTGSHTYNHLNGWKTNNSLYYKNVRKGAEYVESNLFRPPYGKITLLQSNKLHKEFNIIMWDVITKDYDQTIDGNECFENVKNYVQNGSIIVFHDSQKAWKNLEVALPKTIEYLLNEGYSFASIDLPQHKNSLT